MQLMNSLEHSIILFFNFRICFNLAIKSNNQIVLNDVKYYRDITELPCKKNTMKT